MGIASQAARFAALARRWDLGWALAIALVSLVLRVTCARQYTADALGQFLWIDEQAYWARAQGILAGALIPHRPFYQDPLYPYLLAALMVVVGESVAALRLALACLGALTPLALFWAGRVGLGRAEGRIAGCAAAVYGPLVLTDIGLEKEGLGALLAAVALALSAHLARRPTAQLAAPAGLAWGALALLRANALVVGPLGTAWCAWGLPEGTVAKRRPWLALVFAGSFVLCLVPAVVINAMVSRPREFLLTTWQAGPNFYNGNGPEATGTFTDLPFVAAHPFFEASDYTREAQRRTGRRLTPGEVSRFWFLEGLKRWRTAPGASLRLLALKGFLLANDHEVADNHDGQYLRLTAVPALRLGVLRFGWLAPCAALGLGLGRRDRSPFWWFLVVATGAGLATTAVFFVVGRYRIPWVPGLILLGAAGVVDLARRLALEEFRGAAARVLLLVIPAAVLAWAPTPVAADDRWGLALRRQFKACLWSGQPDRALDALDDACALGPRPAQHLAAMLAVGPEHDRWVALLAEDRGDSGDLRRARRLRPIPEGRIESRRILEELLRAHPDDPAVLREWGGWWLGEVRAGAARRRAAAAFRRAATAGDSSAAIVLALLSSDSRVLELPALRGADTPRLRVARAILAERRPWFTLGSPRP